MSFVERTKYMYVVEMTINPHKYLSVKLFEVYTVFENF